MPDAFRRLSILAAMAALTLLAVADAQKPTPPTPPRAPTKPVSTIKPTAAPATGPMTIICKDFAFGQMPGALPYRGDQITYESVSVKDTSGATRTIYTPTRIVITHEFKPAATSIGPDGRGLVSGECGTPTAAITGTTGPALFMFNNFPSVFVQTGKKLANEVTVMAAVNLPPCPSGLRSFRTQRQNANEFFISQASDATCLK